MSAAIEFLIDLQASGPDDEPVEELSFGGVLELLLSMAAEHGHPHVRDVHLAPLRGRASGEVHASLERNGALRLERRTSTAQGVRYQLLASGTADPTTGSRAVEGSTGQLWSAVVPLAVRSGSDTQRAIHPRALDAGLALVEGRLRGSGESAVHVREAVVWDSRAAPTSIRAFARDTEIAIVYLAEGGNALACVRLDAVRDSGASFGPAAVLENVLRDILATAIGVREIERDQSLLEQGLSSLDLLRFISFVHQRLGFLIETSSFAQAPTLAAVSNLYEVRHERRESAFVVPVHVPATRGQSQLWGAEQNENTRGLYNETYVLRMDGVVQLERLRAAFQAIVARHEALRLTIGSDADGRIMLSRGEHAGFAWRVERLIGSISDLAAECAREPFSLDQGPLLRVTAVVSPEDGRCLFIIVVGHHVVLDAWSAALLLEQELPTAYSGMERTQMPARSFMAAAWIEHDALSRRLWATDLAWLARRLEAAQSIELPRRTASAVSDRAEVLHCGDCTDVAVAIAELTSTLRISSFEVLIGALQCVLARFSGNEHLTVGVPAANRPAADWLSSVGFFTNLVPIVAQVNAELPVRDQLRSAATVAREFLLRQHVPFAEVTRHLQVRRDGRTVPFVEVALILETAPPPVKLGDASAITMSVDPRRAKFDLAIHARLHPEATELSLAFVYRADLYDREVVRSIASSLRQFVRVAARNPAVLVKSVPLFEPDPAPATHSSKAPERMPNGVPSRSVLELIREQVRRNPDRAAIFCRSTTTSYEQLWGRALQLHAQIRSLGVQRGTRVGFRMNRGPDAIATLLAVLAAGAVYVPIDPRLSVGIAREIARRAQLSLVLTDIAGDGFASSEVGTPVVLVSELSSSASTVHEPVKVESTDTAYILHTSGSTGVPKGVVVPHRALNHLVNWALQVHTVEELSRVLASSSFSFDMSLFEIFAPLAAGGSMVLVDSILDLATIDRGLAPSLVNTVPTALRSLLRESAIPDSVLCINSAGEHLAQALVEQIYSETRVRRVNDVYGPTETNCVTFGQRRSGESAHVGWVLPGSFIRILDEAGNRAPLGGVGELWIGGDSVADGYVEETQAEAGRFLASDSEEGPARLFRSGDIGRLLPDGRLELVGRQDRQLKVRGYRIEPEAVEAVMARYPEVDDCAVVGRGDGDGTHLVALFVSKTNNRPLRAEALRSFLSAQLPWFSVPDAFVEVSDIPRTTSGKVDRNAFGLVRDKAPRIQAAPTSARERAIARAWSIVLGRPIEDIHSNLFELGADSLAVVQFVQELGREGPRISPETVHECQTIAALALHTESAMQSIDDLRLMQQDLARTWTQVRESRRAGGRTRGRVALITGAAGFLGAHVLVELLASRGFDRICCLIREANDLAAHERLARTLSGYQLDPGVNPAVTVDVIAGDLSRDQFGLSRAAYSGLADVTDIFHVGAEVDFVRPYSALRNTNVHGTRRVLELASEGHPKRVWFVSTLGVADFETLDVVDAARALRMGYLKSKWIGERLIESAVQEGLPCATLRPGRITWSRSGAMAMHDMFVRTIHDFVVLGWAFDAHGLVLDHVMSVDDAAASIVRNATSGIVPRSAVSITSGCSLNVADVIEWTRRLGYEIKQEPYERWQRRVRAAGRSSTVLPAIEVLGSGERPELWRVHAADIGPLPATAVAPDEQSFTRMMKRLVASGYLPAPPHKSGM